MLGELDLQAEGAAGQIDDFGFLHHAFGQKRFFFHIKHNRGAAKNGYQLAGVALAAHFRVDAKGGELIRALAFGAASAI